VGRGNLFWRKAVNPVDWIAWAYGKFFSNHETALYVLVSGLVVVVGVPVACGIVARAIDKYRTEHPITPVLAPSSPPTPTLPNSQPQPPGTQSIPKPTPAPAPSSPAAKQENRPERTLPQADRSIKIGEGAQIISSPMTTGDNSPLTINQIPTSPPARTLSQEKFDRLVNELSGNAVLAVDITLVPADDETGTFGNQIVMAFKKAGWRVSNAIAGTLSILVVTDMGATSFNGDGFTCSARENAPELAKVLKAFAAVDLICVVRHDLSSSAPLSIYIGKRK
jgi:hypothetical protein